MATNRYEVKAKLGYDPITGKQIRKSVYSNISKEDAMEKAQKMEAQYASKSTAVTHKPEKN